MNRRNIRMPSLLIYLLFHLALFRPAYAQNRIAIDSLQQELSKEGLSHSAQADLLIQMSRLYIDKDNKKAEEYSNRAMMEAHESGDKSLIGRAAHVSGIVNVLSGNFAVASSQLKEALAIALAMNDTLEISNALNSLGNLNHKQSNYDQALEYYMRRLDFVSPSDLTALAIIFNNIGLIHEGIDNNAKALEYFSKALEMHQAQGNKKLECGTLVNLGVVYYNTKEYGQALEHYSRALPIANSSGDKLTLSIIHESIGNIQRATGDYTHAIESYNTSLRLSEQLQDEYGTASVSRNLGETYLMKKQYDLALKHLLKSEEGAESAGGKSFLMNSKHLLAKTYFEMGNTKKAYAYLSEYQTLKDSLFNETKNRQIQELQTKYETERKDQEISLLNSEKQLQNAELSKERLIRNMSVAGVLLVVLIAFLQIKNYRQKIKVTHELAARTEEVNRQRLVQLMQEKKLEVMDAVISGEENERKRIAKDLHDGLSGLLAVVKMQFDGVQNESDPTARSKRYTKALHSLNQASGEVRRISHNMMPGILTKYGLIEALYEFIDNIKSAHGLSIEFIHYGKDRRFHETVELTLYRVIQELIHNIVKHAKATEVLLQLDFGNDILMVAVEDNGVGFDTQKMDTSKGIGLSNITSRIHYLGGEINFNSTPENGTAVYIEIDFSKKAVSL